MEEKQQSSVVTKISLGGLILMIFSSIFGWNNSLTAFYQMGYASILWYLVAAILFFVPSSLMFAEYGAAFKAARGGIFSWLRGSIGEKPAFIGTFLWLAAWVVWLVSSSQYFLVAVSTMIFGKDVTTSWHLFGLSSDLTLGILEVLFLVIVTFIATHGIDKIVKVTSFAGIFTMAMPIAFLVISAIILIMHHGTLAEPITTTNLIHSPNQNFVSPIAVVSFLVYAIFAFGGMETMAGVIDNVDQPEKTFPKGVLIGCGMMACLYFLVIFLCGISTNWNAILGKSNVNLANVEYVIINNLGLEMGKGFGMSHANSLLLGQIFSHIAAFADVFGGIGAAFVMTYSPIKSFVQGCDQRLLPKQFTTMNQHGMPAFAMWCQVAVVSCIIMFIACGGAAASTFYTILTDMMNVGSSTPYLFLIGAFPFFKMKEGLDRPFVFYRRMSFTWVVTIIVWLVIAIGIIFTIIQPIIEGEYMTSFWTAFGPVFFGTVAWIFYTRAEKRGTLD
ncbi:glutamate/gamma-aminobutyrate family transporter YjeM [Limosilactobacillus gastricus]|uniref:glutamate/gamma-aminobutyrate family transporter YjeM n=1 Tax=Limosilactobacillus gastricus TaxID=227942 RepID=UPI0026F005FD|nr:glutamate/gamma-aminobutyrate family transporter YjeM [Limosilactobacillus gastricus]